MEQGDHILRLENVTAGYNGTPVLRDVNLAIARGEICCVIGEEGSGKSTLLNAITQQLRSSGRVSYDAIDLSTVSTANLTRHGIDFIAQGGTILDSFTVEEHIRLSLSAKSRGDHEMTWRDV